MRTHGLTGVTGAAVAAAVAAGCATPQIQERFFTLSADTAAERTPIARIAPISVIVGPVTVPELVDRPQFVVRSGANRVDILEQTRWAAPLKSEVPRVIAEHLARLLEGARAGTIAQRAAGAPDYRVLVDLQRFDSSLEQGATLQALWTVQPAVGAPAVSGSFSTNEASGGSYDGLVDAHNRALAALSREIATAIAAARATR